jgi:Fe-S-cluster-containing dehydrogenase component
MMNTDRRQFLKQACQSIIGGGLLIWVMPVWQSLANTSAERKNLYAFIVDTTKCIGCGKCVAACRQENKVPEDFYRTWVERYTILEDGEVTVDSPDGAEHGFKPLEKKGDLEKSFFVPKLCNHCKEPNCVQVCPVGATYVSEEGVVLVDDKHCVGCSYCVQACPYGARFVNPETKTADKCTWCYHRLKKSMKPACVLVCPTGARQIGRIDDEASEINKIIRQNRLQVLKPETGNQPMTMYVGLDREVR